MVDYPYESIAAGLRAVAGVKRERIAQTVIHTYERRAKRPLPIYVYQRGAKRPLPKRIKGWSLTGTGRPYSDWEKAAIKPTVKPVFVPAPWVVGVHTDSNPAFQELPERDW